MLSSINVSSNPLNMSITYISKDIVGQTAGLLYSWKQGKNADKNPLRHSTIGVFMQQSSCVLETMSPFITSSSLIPFLGITSTLKNVSFITVGSVNARAMQNITKKDDNIGYVYSKIASINTLASSFGMILGLFLIYSIPSLMVRSVLCLPILGGLSMYSMRRISEISKENGI
jgi:hypothetical protein